MKLPFLAGVALAAMFMSGCLLETLTPPPTSVPAGGQPAATLVTPAGGSTSTTAPTSASSTISPVPAMITPTPGVLIVEGRQVKQYGLPPLMAIDPNANYTAIIRTNQGSITVELFASQAPNTVNSFVFLAQEGFYNGIIFHRVIQGFMIQGGDPTGTGGGGPG